MGFFDTINKKMAESKAVREAWATERARQEQIDAAEAARKEQEEAAEKARQEQEEAAEKARQEELAQIKILGRQKALDEIQTNGLPDAIISVLDQGSREPASTKVILGNDEKAVMFASVDYYEERAKRRTSGSGVTFRVMKGVYYHTGGAVSYSTPEMTKIDHGALIATTTRLIFSGQLKSFEIPYKKIINIGSGDRHILVSSSGSKKVKVFLLRVSYMHTEIKINVKVNGDSVPVEFEANDEPILVDAIITGLVKKARN